MSATGRKVMSYNNDFGPKWTVNSEELGGGVVALLAVMAAALVLAPAFLFGTWLASNIWNAKIFKYPAGVLFAYLYFKGLMFVWFLSHGLAAFIVILSWVLTDYMLSGGNARNMFIARSLKKTFGWLFSG